jgi:hypothetical protein
MKQLVSILLVLVVLMTGCSSSQIVSNLQFAVDAAEVAFPIVAQQAHLSPAVATQVGAYLQGVNVAISQSAPIIASAEPTPQKVAQISAIFANVAAPNLPPGTPQAVASAVSAVANAVAKFLGSVEATKSLKTASMKPVVPSNSDLAKLSKIENKAKANLDQLKK